MKNLRIGIVGGGGMGRVHFANWQVVENASVVALCDTAPSAADTAAQWGVPLYRSITQMVQECDLDAVDICTPTFLHHDMVMESLNLGMDTICEKPCTTRTRRKCWIPPRPRAAICTLLRCCNLPKKSRLCVNW